MLYVTRLHALELKKMEVICGRVHR